MFNKKKKQQNELLIDIINTLNDTIKRTDEQQKQLNFIFDILSQSGLVEFYKDQQAYIEKYKDKIIKGNC